MAGIVGGKTLDGVVELEEDGSLGVVANHTLEPEEAADAGSA